MAPQKQQQQQVDGRFSRVQRDPRFWEMPERQNKVTIDKRFRSMFHDERFKVKQTVDKRGRPVQHSTEEDLRRFYQLESEEEEEEEEKKEKEKKKTGLKPKADDEDEDEESESESEEAESGPDSDSDQDQDSEGSGSESDSGPDLARGKGNVETSSDEDSEDEVEAILKREEEEIEHDWGDLCKDAPRSDQVWRRVAVCNMDWDRMKAKDLLALFQSFCPKGGAVLSVKIFLSEFGKERLQQEQSQAPLQPQTLPEDSEDDTEEDKTYRERMRQYQFGRLKYQFAVVECDEPQTAAQIYSECDGFEYESSGSILDLRFIPDDVQFEEEPKDIATDVNLTSYCPNLFSSTSSSTAKVQLTWDETDHERVTALNRKFNKEELLNMDFRAYLASSSEEEEPEEEEEQEGDRPKEEEEEEEGQDGVCDDKHASEKPQSRSEQQILKYRELLQGIRSKEQEEEEEGGMEVTWVPGLKQSAEQKLKTRLDSEKLSPWDQYLHKKKEKKKKRGKQDKDSEIGLSDDDLPSDVDLNDPFFKDELSTTDMKKSLKKKKKQKRSRTSDEEEEQDPEEQRRRAQMVLLMEDQDDLKHKHFDFDRIVEQQNLSKNKKKKLKKSGLQPDQDQFQVDVADPRFQAVYTSALFNLDPSHPGFRRTKGTESLLHEKQRRRMDTHGAPPLGPSPAVTTETASPVATPTSSVSMTTKTGLDPGLSQLVKSIKSKTQQHQERRKRQ